MIFFSHALPLKTLKQSHIAPQEQHGFLCREDTTFTQLGGARDGNRAKRNFRHGGALRENEAVKRKRE